MKTPENSDAKAIDVQRLVRLLGVWRARINDTPEKAKTGGVDYVGGLIDAYANCLRELEDIIEADKALRPLTADDVTAAENKGYDHGLRHGREEMMERANDVAAEVMRIVSPEGYDREEWGQVKAAVIRGMKPNAQADRRP